MKLVLVESPAKAKAIQSYLGKDYVVQATYGHVRDLLAKTSAVQPSKDFAMTWEVSAASQKRVSMIAKHAQKADAILLATDPDREGEAIAWHILTLLQEKDPTIAEKPYTRVSFFEISKPAVLQAIKEAAPSLNQNLIDAYRARRALDFLVGFRISPILWRKLPCCRSAGRVQSTALRLICERALEIDLFKPQEYWSVQGLFAYKNHTVLANLSGIDGVTLKKEDIQNQQSVDEILDRIEACKDTFSLTQTTEKKINNKAPAPFTTSTMQQVANKSLNWPIAKAMQVAQSLYEGISINGQLTGLITYMRTDSSRISPNFIESIREFVTKTFGPDYCPSQPVTHPNKTKNAQEAHEAIRPTRLDLPPEAIKSSVSSDQFILYSLIWNRAIASQMSPAVRLQSAIIMEDAQKQFLFKTTVTRIIFQGYLATYPEKEDAANLQMLPDIPKGTPLPLETVTPNQHFTKPPAYYSEASLIQALEEKGIGRPSTYAPTIQTLLKREYITRSGKQLHPELSGRILTIFLTKNLSQYVQDDFTADMENSLDAIAQNKEDWLKLLHTFWDELKQNIETATQSDIKQTFTDAMQTLEHLLLTPHKLSHDNNTCTKCKAPMEMKASRFGFFLGCSHYPECKHTLPLSSNIESLSAERKEAEMFGKDPKTGFDIFSKTGPYGPYLELSSTPVKRISLTPQMQKNPTSMEMASLLFSLPKPLGTLPNGEEAVLMNGRFGPYVKAGKTLVTVPIDQLTSITVNDVPALIEAKEAKAKKKAKKT
ncbi:MAG: type I DNA topoisomerase [Alphaproteobacteria bacterium]|nr:type I DNA topoisomerase [Alphaproteobacteria bacterium]